jgi:hypothetical protein
LLGYAPNAMVGRNSIEMVASDERARVAPLVRVSYFEKTQVSIIQQ